MAASPERNLLSASASVMFHGSLPNAPTRTSVSSTSFAPSSDACSPYCSADAPASAAQSSTISFHSHSALAMGCTPFWASTAHAASSSSKVAGTPRP